MKTVGIIAEYNPFHNGHELLIRKAREGGATHVVIVMSGNFVQRGEPAIFTHGMRTRAALECGADLVIQLPVVYAVSGAQKFARAGVRILDALGSIDEIVFGSECGNTELIVSTARAIYSSQVQSLIGCEMKKGVTFAVARENALRTVDEKFADVIKTPNNILGVEYVSALDEIGSEIKPYAVSRIGAGHGESGGVGETASASYIRELIANGGEWQKYVPSAAAEIFENEIKNNKALVNYAKFETAVLFKLRTTSCYQLSLAPDVSEGIENRILAAASQATSLDELYMLAKTKRYTHARIRRIVLNHLLGISNELLSSPVPYIRILGLNSKGTELIRMIRGSEKLPIISKTADISSAGESAKKMFEAECRATDVYSILTERNGVCGLERDYRVIIVK
ncbi:MAG: nucleotidyltransferase family protein [Clostridia bacterium]|nr:nucleotidyltransferase family protein [Clostridia bacterium]